jgi:hypothetical protein
MTAGHSQAPEVKEGAGEGGNEVARKEGQEGSRARSVFDITSAFDKAEPTQEVMRGGAHDGRQRRKKGPVRPRSPKQAAQRDLPEL